ncbi:DEAD/DEAH box helicase [Gammaproteobacteria bacterium]|nr:DEAD/DEAH box helicase [Gammaproteobacteria bacterium]
MQPCIKCSLSDDKSAVNISWDNIKDSRMLTDRINNLFFTGIVKTDFNAEISLGSFLLHVVKLREFWTINLGSFQDFNISEELVEIYKSIPSLDNVIQKNKILDEQTIQDRLVSLGWNPKWILKKTQLRNVSKIVNLPSSANFSVPGAGKTTEALAVLQLKKINVNDKCLIIAPKSAFEAWEEDIPNCLTANNTMINLDGSLANIRAKLNKSANFYIINYEKIRYGDDENIPQYCYLIASEIAKSKNNFSIICDEAHRLRGDKTYGAIRLLAPLVQNKIILTGTPCPQSLADLDNQFRFLYPKENYFNSDEIAKKFQSIYVRTRKKDLKDELPVIKEELIKIPNSGNLKQVYDAITSEIKDEKFDRNSKQFLRKFSRVVIKLVRLCANPRLVLNDIYEMDFELGEKLADEGLGPKIKMILSQAVELIKDGNKVIIWSHFPDSIDDIFSELDTYNFNPVKLYGGMDMGDKITGHLEPGTRRYAIDQFKNNPQCMAFIANPMAAGEGISLHHICRHALYADRSFSVAHYLQSKDRIHRIGGDISKDVNIKVYSLTGTIDERVYELLKIKTEIMARFLDDSDINTNFIQYDIDFETEQTKFLSEYGDWLNQNGSIDDSKCEDLQSLHTFLIES